MEQAFVGETYYLQIFVSGGDGKGIPGLTVNYKIYKAKGGLLVKQGKMIEDLTTPGVYVQGHTFTQAGRYRLLYQSPNNYYDSMITIDVT